MGIDVRPAYELLDKYFGEPVKVPLHPTFSLISWKVNEDLYIDHVIGRQTLRLYAFNKKFRICADSSQTSTQSVIIAEAPIAQVNEFIGRILMIRSAVEDFPPRHPVDKQ